MNFYQAVVKQNNFLDSSGSWKVIIDDSVAGISTPTISNLAFQNVALQWQYRSIMFVATSTTHTIKFLPADDDTILNFPNPYAGLRMGIDLIYISQVFLLPIELVDFSATPVKENIILNWTTASETNNDYFTIERSGSDMKWTEVDKIPGSGTSSEIRKYSVIDVPSEHGIIYYRLKQTDYDGNFTYSKTVSVYFNGSEVLIYPNPASDKIITVQSALGKYQISLYHISSNTVLLESKISSIRNEIDVSKLPRGLYVQSIENDVSMILREKVIIN